MKPLYEVADIIKEFAEDYYKDHKPPKHVKRILRALTLCRTSTLGGHAAACNNCGIIRYSYNSCRNRHCPKCQSTNKERWVEDRLNDLLPVPYFHVVFTLPDTLNALCLKHPSEMYAMLFKASWKTIEAFCSDPKYLAAEGGMISLLHTWGQNLSLHPHVHCIVPGGGIDYTGRWKKGKKIKHNYLFCVKALSKTYRSKFFTMLKEFASKEKIALSQSFIDNLYKHEWVVYAKPPFAGAKGVIEYLGRYSHKVAISNHRIINIDKQEVKFTWKDYRSNGNQKSMQLKGTEFLRRFALHILPSGFVRIRHYGILSSTRKQALRELQNQFGITSKPVKDKKKKDWKQISIERLGYNPDLCPCCKKGIMIIIENIAPLRGPPIESLKIKAMNFN